ncbi:MAG: sigma-70 family RNA polymerase sigma factor [Saprospiraceae bacterium]|nr:sigma-70 family RNA polymerase sigma factor [Saprospiraceae bacterium]
MQTAVADIKDEQILNLIQREDQQERGFKLLLDKYQERLYWHIRKLVINHEDANDVTQNCLIKVFRGIQRFQGNSSLYTWLYRIATNESITFLNKKKKIGTDSIDNEALLLAEKLKADVYFDGNEIQLALQKAICILPEKQRAVFQLRYFEEMSYQQMSEVLETSVGGLKASYHHAVKKIEKALKAG